MTLAEAFKVRRNAIAFLRVAFAVLVMLGHAWEFGGFGEDPLKKFAGVTLGQLGLHAFFVIGGFLVTGSFLNSGSWRTFLINRALRIFPGYWACLIITVTVLAPVALNIGGRASNGSVIGLAPFLDYFTQNFFLRLRQPHIGGLFAHHPAAGVVNGSLWSIFPEAVCYLLLCVAGLMGILRGRRRGWLLAAYATSAACFAANDRILAALVGSPLQSKAWYFLQIAGLGACFSAGALAWALRHKLPCSFRIQALASVCAIAVIAAGAYRWLGPVILPPVVLALATRLPWTAFDRFGDFSYGLYLYHCPVQQILYGAHLGRSAPVFFVLSMLATLPLAALSWFLIEKPALRLKPKSLHPAVAHTALPVANATTANPS